MRAGFSEGRINWEFYEFSREGENGGTKITDDGKLPK